MYAIFPYNLDSTNSSLSFPTYEGRIRKLPLYVVAQAAMHFAKIWIMGEGTKSS
jgi:hypothetical protein